MHLSSVSSERSPAPETRMEDNAKVSIAGGFQLNGFDVRSTPNVITCEKSLKILYGYVYSFLPIMSEEVLVIT